MERAGHVLQDYVSAYLGPLFKQMQFWQYGTDREHRDQTGRSVVSRVYNDMEVHEPDRCPDVRPEHAEWAYVPRRHEYQRHSHPRIAGDYARTLGKAAEHANSILQKAKSNSRFYVFEQDGKLFMNIVMLDTNGEIKFEHTREITNEDFVRSINNVRDIEGLLLDDLV